MLGGRKDIVTFAELSVMFCYKMGEKDGNVDVGCSWFMVCYRVGEKEEIGYACFS